MLLSFARMPAVLVACGLFAGCGDDSSTGKKTHVYPVLGKLVIDDRPAVNARVAFHPVDKSLSTLCPVGVVGPDGSFQLMTFATDDGAPAGDYIVTVIWPHDAVPFDDCGCFDPLTHDRLRGLYADPATSTLRARVLPQMNEILLEASVGPNGWNLPRRRLAADQQK